MMEQKVVKWSKVLKWVILFALVWRSIGLGWALSDELDGSKWTDEAIQNEIYEKLERYGADRVNSNVILQEKAIQEYTIEKKFFMARRVTEEGILIILLMIGYIITRRLSRQCMFDDSVCKLIKGIGAIILISSVLIPVVGNVNTGLEILLPVDIYKFICGLAVMVLAYILKQGKFLQDEYDMTL